MTDGLTIRPMHDDDLPGVLDTMRAALGETPTLRRTEQQWAWKHIQNPFGESIVLVAAEGSRIAGVRAFMRWRLQTPGGHDLSCVRAVDTAIHPEFRRRGLFTRLNEAALDMAVNDGVDLVFNTPNSQSRPGYLKQGWRDVGPIGVMIRPSLRAFRRRPNDELPDSTALLPTAGAAADLGGDDRHALGLRTPRSHAYRAWRFDSHPRAEYRRIDAGGATAVVRLNRRDGRDELVVSELIGSDASQALSATLGLSRAAYAVGWFSKGSPERRATLRSGLIPVPRLAALHLVARPMHPLDVNVFDLANWDLSLSDLELL